jgi:hypothetical protein
MASETRYFSATRRLLQPIGLDGRQSGSCCTAAWLHGEGAFGISSGRTAAEAAEATEGNIGLPPTERERKESETMNNRDNGMFALASTS